MRSRNNGGRTLYEVLRLDKRCKDVFYDRQFEKVSALIRGYPVSIRMLSEKRDPQELVDLSITDASQAHHVLWLIDDMPPAPDSYLEKGRRDLMYLARLYGKIYYYIHQQTVTQIGIEVINKQLACAKSPYWFDEANLLIIEDFFPAYKDRENRWIDRPRDNNYMLWHTDVGITDIRKPRDVH